MAGVFGFLGAAWALAGMQVLTSNANSLTMLLVTLLDRLHLVYDFQAVALAVLSAFAIFASALAVPGTHRAVSLAGAFCAALVFLPCGIPAIILLLRSHRPADPVSAVPTLSQSVAT